MLKEIVLPPIDMKKFSDQPIDTNLIIMSHDFNVNELVIPFYEGNGFNTYEAFYSFQGNTSIIIQEVFNQHNEIRIPIVNDVRKHKGIFTIELNASSASTKATLLKLNVMVKRSNIDSNSEFLFNHYYKLFEDYEKEIADLNNATQATIKTQLKQSQDNLQKVTKTLIAINDKVMIVNDIADGFITDVVAKQADVTSKYNAFDTDITEVNQTIDELLALQPQFQAVLDETTGKEVISAPEIILARNGEANLKARLDKDQQQVTAQLAHTTALLNQLKNISLYGEIKPFIVESMVDFGWVAYGTPAGYNNYSGGNLFFGVSGNKGDSFVTVTSGDITDAGSTRWAAVLKDDDGNWTPVKVTGVSGNTLLIFPSLEKNILDGEIGNLHDEPRGQHYTERGYYALAQHIYKYKPKYAERNKFITSFDPQLDTLAENPFTLTGNARSPTIFATTPFLNDITFRDSQKTLSVGGSAGYSLTHEWEVQLDNKRGFLETSVSAVVNAAKIEFYLDDVLTHSQDVPTSGKVTKVYYDFANAQTGKIKIYFPTSTAFHTIYIGKTTWWLNEKKEVPKLIPPHSKVVYLGDSWGVYHDKAITRELERLLTTDTGTGIEVLNDSKGVMTSKWGKAWFNEYVLKHKPTHVIIEFFTNDFNSIYVPSNAYNYLAPDGQTFNGNIASVSEWVQNIFDMVNLSIENGIQPIVVAPAPTAVDSRLLGSLNNSKLLLKGTQQ